MERAIDRQRQFERRGRQRGLRVARVDPEELAALTAEQEADVALASIE